MAPEEARRPAHLLSGLTRCGVCGGGFSSISATHCGCSTARNKGTCNNRLGIRRDVLEASVLEGLKRHLMAPELVKEFIAEYHAELNRLMAGREGEATRQRAELAQVERQIRSIIEAIKEGLRTASMKDELLALEARKEGLPAALAKAPDPLPRLHPNLAEIYRQRAAELHESLNRPEARAEAAELLRGLIEAIRLVPEQGRLEIELSGDLAAILGLCEGRGVGIKNPRRGLRTGVHETLVAGARYQLYLLLFAPALALRR
jgi:hypothetical protein